MDYPRHIVCVAGLFTNAEGKVLLVKTPRRGWETPGGQVELGEDLTAALLRVTAPGPALRLRDALETGERPRYRVHSRDPFAVLQERGL